MFFLLYPVVMSFKMCLFVFDQSGSKFFKLCTCKLKLVLNAQYLKKKINKNIYNFWNIQQNFSIEIYILFTYCHLIPEIYLLPSLLECDPPVQAYSLYLHQNSNSEILPHYLHELGHVFRLIRVVEDGDRLKYFDFLNEPVKIKW